jgi:hypothetical protein
MSTIKGLGPQVQVAATEQVRAPVVAGAAAQPKPMAAPQDGFHLAASTAAETPQTHTPVTGALFSGLTLIASLKQHPFFGTGARVRPLKPGEQSLGEEALDATLLAVDLAGELERDLADPGHDQHRRAAIAALFAGYPGGRAALTPVS